MGKGYLEYLGYPELFQPNFDYRLSQFSNVKDEQNTKGRNPSSFYILKRLI